MKRERADVRELLNQHGLEGFNIYYTCRRHRARSLRRINIDFAISCVTITKNLTKRISLSNTIKLLNAIKIGKFELHYLDDDCKFSDLEDFRRYVLIMTIAGVSIDNEL